MFPTTCATTSLSEAATVGDRYKVDLSRFKEKHTPQGIGHHRGQEQGDMECGMVSFLELGDFRC